jgi:hypothetical protein
MLEKLMMMDFAPIARIVLRYAVGAGLFASQQIGNMLAQDPDLVFVVSGLIGAAVEVAYAWAKTKGGKT